jgi:hypothetical protein
VPRGGEIDSTPIYKAGGFDPSGPDAAFYRSYFAEPELVLPAGIWDIGATLNVSLVGCGDVDDIARVAIRVIVAP